MNLQSQPLNQNDEDQRYIMAAIRFARRNRGNTGSNPSVACLIVAGVGEDKWIAGRGVTAVDGRPHAEPVAIEEAGKFCKGATAYVTLEPCSHHATTPPCSHALINAGITRVVTAQLDPDSRVNGKGHEICRDAGLSVTEAICTKEAEWDLRAYRSRKSRQRPWVTLKLAVTADGYLGLKFEGQVAITGAVANAQTHLLRARNDAILVGSGTVEADDPQLTCRADGLGDRSPLRVVLENKTPIDPSSKMVRDTVSSETLICCPLNNETQRTADLAQTNVSVKGLQLKDDCLNLHQLMDFLIERECSSLLIEGGKETATRFLEAGLVDEIIMYISREKMSDKIKASSNANWIHWPAAPEVIPDGFQIAGQWVWGTDKMVRMVRNEGIG